MKILWLTIGSLLVASTAAAQTPDGKALYDKNCKMCHGSDGKPSQAMLKIMPTLPILSAGFMASRSDDSVVKVLANGTAKMKAYKAKLTPEEMAAVAKYTRQLAKRPEGPP